jgi:LPXTG-site transpeptidase (sortase) family protein
MSFFRPKIAGSLNRRQKIGLILILFAGVCFVGFFGLKIYFSNPLSFSQKPKIESKFSEDQYPARIIIPSLKIDLPVFPAKAEGNKWEIFENAASYLLGSGIPGQKGNVVVYSHNKRHLFGPILGIKKGAEIKIENKKGENFSYEVLETRIVSPSQIEILLPSTQPILTLYTCTGFADSKRFVVIARLK